MSSKELPGLGVDIVGGFASVAFVDRSRVVGLLGVALRVGLVKGEYVNGLKARHNRPGVVID